MLNYTKENSVCYQNSDDFYAGSDSILQNSGFFNYIIINKTSDKTLYIKVFPQIVNVNLLRKNIKNVLVIPQGRFFVFLLLVMRTMENPVLAIFNIRLVLVTVVQFLQVIIHI